TRPHRRKRTAPRADHEEPRLRSDGPRVRARGRVMARTDDETRRDSADGRRRGAAHDFVADSAPAQARDEFTERIFAAFEDEDTTKEGGTASGAIDVLRRGIRTSPELRVGLKATIVFAIVAAIGKLAIPILIQIILDKGVLD